MTKLVITIELDPRDRDDAAKLDAIYQAVRSESMPADLKIKEETVAQPKTEQKAKEPVAKEPVAKEPVAKEPVAKEPVAKEPVAKEPVVKEAVVEEAVVEEEILDETPTSSSEKPSYTIEEVRGMLAQKVSDHRAEIKAKLTSLGAPNVTNLDPAKYGEFVSYLMSL